MQPIQHSHQASTCPRVGAQRWAICLAFSSVGRRHSPSGSILFQVASLASHITLFLIILESPVLSLFIVPISFCLSCFSTYLFLLVVPRVSDVRGHVRSGLRGAMPLLCITSLDRVISGLVCVSPQPPPCPGMCTSRPVIISG